MTEYPVAQLDFGGNVGGTDQCKRTLKNPGGLLARGLGVCRYEHKASEFGDRFLSHIIKGQNSILHLPNPQKQSYCLRRGRPIPSSCPLKPFVGLGVSYCPSILHQYGHVGCMISKKASNRRGLLSLSPARVCLALYLLDTPLVDGKCQVSLHP